MQRITEDVTLHRVERVVVEDSRLAFEVEDEETYLWDGDEGADWEIDGAVVEGDPEGVAARPMDDYFVCEISANRAVNNVGPVRCHSVEGGR